MSWSKRIHEDREFVPQDRRYNPYRVYEFSNQQLGIMIAENGFQVCMPNHSICPVPAVMDWSRAKELLDIVSNSNNDRRG